MSKYKIDKYAQDYISEIYQQSNEYKMYEFGLAYGYFSLLKGIKSYLSKEDREDILKVLCGCEGTIYDHLRKLVEADKHENSKTDDLIEKFEEFKRK